MNKNVPDQDHRNVPRNVRGKKTRDPGYQPGNHWIECERCGSVIRSQDAKKEWTGLWVCPDDWEMRHSQDFVRGRVDEIAASEPNRPESTDVFVDKEVAIDVDTLCGEPEALCGHPSALCSDFSGTSIIGNTPDYSIPQGTFDNSL